MHRGLCIAISKHDKSPILQSYFHWCPSLLLHIFVSFGSLVGIRRPFRNAADDGGYKRHFCACSNLASSRSERLKYVLNIFEIFSKCSWWWWLTRDVFVPARIGIVPVWTFEIFLKCSWWWWLTRDVFVLARIWHRPGLNVWNMAPTSDHTLHFKGWKYKRPLFDFFKLFISKKTSIHLVMESRSDNWFALLKNHSRCDV